MIPPKETVLAFLRTSTTDRTETLRALHAQRVEIYTWLRVSYGPDEYELTEVIDDAHSHLEPEAEGLERLMSLIAPREYDVLIVANRSVLTRSEHLLGFIERSLDWHGTELVLAE